MKVLVDTNILSELARLRPNAGVLTWSRSVSRIMLSAVTIEEIVCGLEWRPIPRIEAWFESFVANHCEVLDVTADVARCAGHLRGSLRSRGSQRSQADMLIAATALLHGLSLVTRNIDDFEGCGIALLNPFT